MHLEILKQTHRHKDAFGVMKFAEGESPSFMGKGIVHTPDSLDVPASLH